MIIKKINKKEHKRTRILWESVFKEDSQSFLNYYYSIKTRKNSIYTIENKGDILAMLQLNPYQIAVQSKEVLSNYIVAVATDSDYRKQGLMARLLKRSMRDMYENKEPFTFLMPAAEAIYYPYDFRFVYDQGQSFVGGMKQPEESKIEFVEATEADCTDIGAFADSFLEGTHEIYARRDTQYYEVLLAEVKSERGGIILGKKNEKLIGYFAYGMGEKLEIREPLFLEGYESAISYGIYELMKSNDKVKCIAYGEERKKPMIMFRILHLQALFQLFEVEESIKNCNITIVDTYIEENNKTFKLSSLDKTIRLEEASIEKKNDIITIGALTSLLFGYLDVETVSKQPGVVLSEGMKRELSKIRFIDKIFLNEIV